MPYFVFQTRVVAFALDTCQNLTAELHVSWYKHQYGMYMYICAHVCMHEFKFRSSTDWVCIDLAMTYNVCTCTCTCINVFTLYIVSCILDIYMYMYMYMYIHVHGHEHVCIQVHMYSTCIHVCTCTYSL